MCSITWKLQNIYKDVKMWNVSYNPQMRKRKYLDKWRWYLTITIPSFSIITLTTILSLSLRDRYQRIDGSQKSSELRRTTAPGHTSPFISFYIRNAKPTPIIISLQTVSILLFSGEGGLMMRADWAGEGIGKGAERWCWCGWWGRTTKCVNHVCNWKRMDGKGGNWDLSVNFCCDH